VSRALSRLSGWKAAVAARLFGSPDRGWRREERRILAAVAPYTMVHASGVAFTMHAALAAIRSGLPGVLVECGVWKGGCSLAVLLAQRAQFGRVVRPLYLLDSFAGLPPVEERDGPLAKAWQTGAQPDRFLDNCAASESDLHATLRHFGFGDADYRVVPGWFEQTVPPLAAELRDEGIALLRLDGDWYGSTRTCLDGLVPVTRDGATVIIDDYYAWDGCARAVHDFLSQNDVPYRLKSLYGHFGAYFVKRPHRDSFDEF
jgi:O-methyltransferase